MESVLENMDDLSFSIFDLKNAADGNELYVITNFLYKRHSLFQKLKIDGKSTFCYLFFRCREEVSELHVSRAVEIH